MVACLSIYHSFFFLNQVKCTASQTANIHSLAYEFAQRNGTKHSYLTTERRAERDRAMNFMKHYLELSLHWPQATSMPRLTKFNKIQLGWFYGVLRKNWRKRSLVQIKGTTLLHQTLPLSASIHWPPLNTALQSCNDSCPISHQHEVSACELSYSYTNDSDLDIRSPSRPADEEAGAWNQCTDYLMTVPPTSVETERAVSAVRSCLDDSSLDALCFLHAYYNKAHQWDRASGLWQLSNV